MTDSKFYFEYPFDTSLFNDSQLKLIDLLRSAGLKIGALFKTQLGDTGLPGAAFYPADATKYELEAESLLNPAILDPYTIVKRDARGKLYTIYYHDIFKTELTEICELLAQAAVLAEEPSFKFYLEPSSKCLLTGEYSKIEKAWLNISNASFLHCMIGPLGSYADRLFSLKKSYNFNITFTNTSTDSAFNPLNYVEVVKNMLPPFGSKNRVDVPASKIKVRVDSVIAIGGRNAALPARAVNYPGDVETIKECGIKIIVYCNNIVRRDKGMLLPLFRDLMQSGVSLSFSDEFIMANAVRLVLMHEITEAIFLYDGSWERLKGMQNPLQELHSSIIGLKACGYQVIKGALTQKDLEAMCYVMLMRTFSDYYVRRASPQVENYLIGYRVFYNYCLEHGAIKLEEHMILPNISKMFVCVDQIANVVMHLYAQGTETKAKDFMERYGNEFMYDHFSAKLLKYDFK